MRVAEPNGQSRTRSDLLRFLVLFSALYVGFGVASPFFPAFLSSRGTSPEQIGLVLSLSGLVRLVSGPLAGRLADRIHGLRLVLSASSFGAALCAAAFWPSTEFAVLFVIALLYAATLAPTTTLADALALRAATPETDATPRFEYGRVRGSGSAAFVIGSLVSGQMQGVFPPISALIGQAICLTLAAGAALRVPEVDTACDRNPLPTRSAITLLITNRPFRLLVLVAAIALGSHAMHDSFAVIAWNAAGISPAIGSVLWSEQVAAEVIVFVVVGPWLLRRLNPVPAMVLSVAAAVLRWTVLAQSTSVLPLALVEPLHGLSFALLHLACMRILVRVTPTAFAATAQAIYAFGIGAASALLTLASGFLYADFGSAGFFAMAVLAALALPAVWALAHALRPLEPA